MQKTRYDKLFQNLHNFLVDHRSNQSDHSNGLEWKGNQKVLSPNK